MDNGDSALVITWDAQTHTVGVRFDSRHFKTWDFVIAVLDMAKQKAEETKRLGQIKHMQRQALEAAQDQAIAKQLKLG